MARHASRYALRTSRSQAAAIFRAFPMTLLADAQRFLPVYFFAGADTFQRQ